MLEFIQELSHMNSPFTEHRVEHSKNSVGKRRQGHLWLTPGLFKIHCLQSNIFLFLKTFKSKYVFPFCLILHLRPFWLSKVGGGKMGMCHWTGYGFQPFQVLELTGLSINRTFFLARNAFSPQKRNNIAGGNLPSHFGRT